MGVVTGKGLSDLIREEFGLRVTFLIMALLVIVNLTNVMSEFAGVASSLELFRVSRYITRAAFGGGGVVPGGEGELQERRENFSVRLPALRHLHRFRRSWCRPDWKEAAIYSVKPVVMLEPSYIYMLIGMVGTTIAPWMQFYLQSAVVEKGITRQGVARRRGWRWWWAAS